MNADNSQLLDQLRDIHASGDPGWWPPAPGWWLLVMLLLIGLFFAGKWLRNRLEVRRRRREYLLALDGLSHEYDPAEHPHEYLSGLNRIFRMVAMKAFPSTACTHMQGDEWVRFIASLLPEKAQTASLAALSHGPYEPAPEFDVLALEGNARTWVRLYG
jgi:hypothetical protein